MDFTILPLCTSITTTFGEQRFIGCAKLLTIPVSNTQSWLWMESDKKMDAF